MVFNRIRNGAGALLLAVCFCAGMILPATASTFISPELQVKLADSDKVYASLLSAYENRKWSKVLSLSKEFSKQYALLNLSPRRSTAFSVDRDEKNRQDKGIKFFNSLRKKKKKEFVMSQGLAAIALAHKRDFVAAHDILRTVEDSGDDYAVIPAARGVIAYKMKDYNAAEPFLKTAHMYDSTMMEPVYYLYKIALKKGEYGTAYFWLEKAAALAPERLNLMMAQGRLLQKLGQSSAAEIMYSKLIERDSSNAVAYNNRGYCRIALGKLDAAFSDFNSAISINSEYSEALLNRAALWRATGNLPAAIEDLNTGLASTPSDARLLVSRMQTFSDMGDFVSAKADMEQILLLSGSISAVNEAAWFLATSPDDSVRDGTRAVALLLPLVERSKRHPRVLDSLAAAYAASGEFEKAVATQQEAVKRGVQYRLPNFQLTKYEKRLALYKENKPFKTGMDD